MEPHGAAAAAAAAHSDRGSIVTGRKVIVSEEVRGCESIRSSFIEALGSHASRIQALFVRRYTSPTAIWKARIDSFQIYARATARIRGGDANVKHAWYGGSGGMEEIRGILQNGFGHAHIYLSGCLRLSPEECPALSMRRSVPDGNGFRHLLLCRVILGRMEVVSPGTDLRRSSSLMHDSGVDNDSSPKEYFIWSNRMNTHVLPEFLLSFKVPSTEHLNVVAAEPERPIFPSIPFPTLIKGLSKILPSPEKAFIAKSFQDYSENKISRQLLVSRLRAIAGEKLLVQVIKSFQAH